MPNFAAGEKVAQCSERVRWMDAHGPYPRNLLDKGLGDDVGAGR
jgi:hypothetical protein